MSQKLILFCLFIKKMEKAVIKKKTEIFDLLEEFKELINLHSDKVSEYLKNEYYFQRLEEKL